VSTTPAPRILVRGDLRTIADEPPRKAALTATVAASPYADEQGRKYVVTDEAVHSQRPVFAVRATGEWTCELVWAAGTVYRISAPGWMPDVMVYCDTLTLVDGFVAVDARDLIEPPGGDTPVEYVTLQTVIASIDGKVTTAVEDYLTAHPPTAVTDQEYMSSRHGRSIVDYPRQSGETHDMPRFERALDAIAADGGGRLVVPWIAGGYEFRFTPGSTILSPTRLLIRTDNVDIVGIGQPLIRMTGLTTEYLHSIDDYASSGRDIFTAFSFAGVKDCSITGIDFAGEYTTDTIFRYQSPRAIAVAFKGATNCRAQSIGGRNIHGNLINVTGSYITYDAPFAFASKVNISNVFAENCLENGVNYMGGTRNCTADTITATNCANGLETACDGFTANGLIFSANKGSGLALSGKRVVINGLISTGNIRNVTGTPDPNYGYGIVITGGEDIQINAPNLNDNYAHAVFIYPGVKKVQITNPEARRNATDATYKTVFHMVGTSTNRIEDVTITGGIIEAKGAVTGSIVNFADRVRVIGMHGTFETAPSAFTFYADASGSRASGNRFNKAVTMNDPTGEESDNGLYRRIDRTSAPSTGTWIVGDVINNRSRSQGSVAEWNCIQSGTFGTLNAGGTTASTTAASTVVTVNSATGLYVGAYITIAGVSGVCRVAALDGTTVTLDVAADVSVSGAAVSYRPPVVIVSRQNGPKLSVSTTPDFAGQLAVTGGAVYIAAGTSSPSDWKQVS